MFDLGFIVIFVYCYHSVLEGSSDKECNWTCSVKAVGEDTLLEQCSFILLIAGEYYRLLFADDEIDTLAVGGDTDEVEIIGLVLWYCETQTITNEEVTILHGRFYKWKTLIYLFDCDKTHLIEAVLSLYFDIEPQFARILATVQYLHRIVSRHQMIEFILCNSIIHRIGEGDAILAFIFGDNCKVDPIIGIVDHDTTIAGFLEGRIEGIGSGIQSGMAVR